MINAFGNISIVTDEIETFIEAGIQLKSGQELEVDIVVSATGLHLYPLGNNALGPHL